MSFLYVASPYSHANPEIMHQRFLRAEHYCANALRNNHWVYSPIVHCHEMARRHGLPTDAKFWAAYNKAMMEAASGLEVLMLPGWTESKGVNEELGYAQLLFNLPIHHIPENHEWLRPRIDA